MDIKNILGNIRIVLIHTSHPGNIGSAARAMKTMGLNDLILVNPNKFPDDQATAMASHADDILQGAKVVDTLPEALLDCTLVVGSSARSERSLRWNIVAPRQASESLVNQAKKGKVAILFGRESSGLSNDELALCQHLVHIPTNPDYSSLNVASAVQLLGYECRMAAMSDDFDGNNENEVSTDDVVTAENMEGYYQHLETAMIESGFLDPENPRHLMTRLRRLYGRVQLSHSELNILRGMLSAFQKAQKK